VVLRRLLLLKMIMERSVHPLTKKRNLGDLLNKHRSEISAPLPIRARADTE